MNKVASERNIERKMEVEPRVIKTDKESKVFYYGFLKVYVR